MNKDYKGLCQDEAETNLNAFPLAKDSRLNTAYVLKLINPQ